jgi:hypothetical protein
MSAGCPMTSSRRDTLAAAPSTIHLAWSASAAMCVGWLHGSSGLGCCVAECFASGAWVRLAAGVAAPGLTERTGRRCRGRMQQPADSHRRAVPARNRQPAG